MGTELNPRSFGDTLDWKMFAELRVSWVTLFLLTASAAAKQARARRDAAFFLSRKLGDDFLSAAVARAVIGKASYVSSASLLILAAHWLYANACQKGEACVPYTWDVFHEKFGWMLLWWNVAGVPFVYSATSFVVAETDPRLSSSTTALLWVTLLSAYYVWDVAQAQRVTFRARHVVRNRTKTNENEYDAFRVPDDGADDAASALVPPGGLPARPWAFPKLPWSELRSPTFLETRGGGAAHLRVHGHGLEGALPADFCMALVWAFSSGGSPVSKPAAFLPRVFRGDDATARGETRRGAREIREDCAGSARRCRTSGPGDRVMKKRLCFFDERRVEASEATRAENGD